MEICFKITDDNLKEFRGTVIEWYGIILTDNQIMELMKDRTWLIEELLKGGIGDTCVREKLIYEVLDFFLDIRQSWPINGDSPEYKREFHKKLVEALDREGFQHIIQIQK